MRKLILVPALLCGIAITAGAQTKITARLTCAKPSVREGGGEGAQMITFQRANCTWTTPLTIAGSKAGRTVDASIGDISGSTVFDNGDSTFVRFEGNLHLKKDGSSTDKGTWRYVRGTGKFTGISGSGTFKGEGAADGSSWADVSGHYSLGKGKAKK